MTIDERNRIRTEAHLPLLDVDAEQARLAKVEADAEFESYFAQRRPAFQHLWSDSGGGFVTRKEIYNQVGRNLRDATIEGSRPVVS
jgi:hypothetical protein